MISLPSTPSPTTGNGISLVRKNQTFHPANLRESADMLLSVASASSCHIIPIACSKEKSTMLSCPVLRVSEAIALFPDSHSPARVGHVLAMLGRVELIEREPRTAFRT